MKNSRKGTFYANFYENYFLNENLSSDRIFVPTFDICQILTFRYDHRNPRPKKNPHVKFDISDSSRSEVVIFLNFKNHLKPYESSRYRPKILIIFFLTKYHPLFPKSDTRTDSSGK